MAQVHAINTLLNSVKGSKLSKLTVAWSLHVSLCGKAKDNNTLFTSRVGIVGRGVPSSCLQTLILGVKIGFKFQSLGKISNISAADPPPPVFYVNSNTVYKYSNTRVKQLSNITRIITF